MDKIVNAINLMTQAILSVRIVSTIAHCFMDIVTPAVTTVITAGTFYKEASATHSISVDDFTHSIGRMTYTGKRSFICRIICATTFSCNKNNATILVTLAVNGIIDPNFTMERKLAAGGDVGSATFAGIATLSPDDYLEIFISSDINDTDVTLTHAKLTAK